MLGPLSLYPLLKGWDHRPRVWTRTVPRGETIEVDRIEAAGWLKSITIVTNDCYGGARFEYQGADLELQAFELTPEAAHLLGANMQDPAGWNQRYYRPNPKTTDGIYVSVIMSSGWQGYAMPYVPTTIINLFLEEGSTQSSATVQLHAYCIETTDEALFMRSLRSVLGMPVVQPIDPALLTWGREPLAYGGPQDKEVKKK